MSKKRKPGRCRRAVTRQIDWKSEFLKLLADNGNLTLSGRLLGVGRTTVYDHIKNDAAFAKACSNAVKEAHDMLEAEAWRRAYEGIDEPVIHQGEVSGVWVTKDGTRVSHLTPGAKFIPLTVKKYDNGLLMFLMKANRPKRFRENYKVDVGGKVKVSHDVDLSKLSIEQLKALEDIAKTAVTVAGPGGDQGGTSAPQPS